MNRRERFFFIASAPLVAASMLLACSDDDRRVFDEAPDAAPDSRPNLPDASAPLEDAGVIDARVPVDASDEPVVCTAKPCVTQLVGAGNHFCALLDDKTVHCWGSAAQALGTFDGGAAYGAAQPSPISMGVEGAEQISSANATTCALLANGTVTCWGANGSNELGYDPPSSSYQAHDPALVAGGGGVLDGIKRIDVGAGMVFATKASSELWSWGDNGDGLLGRMNEPADYLSPGKATDFAGEKIWRAGGVGFRWGFSGIGFAITEDRRLLTWGNSKQAVAYPGPVPVAVAGLENVSSASAIQDHLCAVADGRLYCWGRNGLKACSGTADVITSPLEIRTHGKAPAQQVALQYDNTCVRLTDGTVECCGNDNLGQLGTGITDAGDPVSAPVLTKATAFTAHAVQIAVGATTICALVQGGTVQCWGGNADGQLGQGTRDTERHPVPVTVKFD